MTVIEALKRRRSTRHFEPDGLLLPREDIEELIQDACLAPSEFGVQPWRFIVVRDRERKQLLYECAFHQDLVRQASAVVVICGDTRADARVGPEFDARVAAGLATLQEARTRTELVRRTIEAGPRARMQMAVRAPSYVAMSLMLLATERGLASAPIAGFSEEALRRAFAIPDRYLPVLLVALGLAALDRPSPARMPRLPAGAIVFHEDMGAAEP